MVNLNSIPNTSYLFETAIFVSGLCFGSFLNVCIWRIPRKESIVFTPSHCLQCNKKIKWYHNIPILSWIILLGRCSKCGCKISIRYPIVEFVTGIIVLLLWLKVTNGGLPLYTFFLYICLTFLFIPTFFIDLKYSIIPNRLNLIALIIILFIVVCFPGIVGAKNSLSGFSASLFGLILAGGVLYFFNFIGKLFYKKGDLIGMGDIKFIAVIGAAFGVYSINWLMILLIGAWIGAITGGILILFGKRRISDTLPFGTFLVIAGYLWIFLGSYLTNLYFSLFK